MEQYLHHSKLWNILEWDLISSKISQYSHFINTTKKRILVNYSSKEIQKTIKRTQIFLENYYSNDLNALRGFIALLDNEEKFSEDIEKISRSGLVDLNGLNQLALLLELYSDASHLSSIIREHYFSPEMKKSLQKIFRNFIKDFRSFYSQDGDYDYLRHPKLRDIYKRQLELESKIRKSLEFKLSQLKDYIQFSSYDIINERYVIPIKTDHYQSQLGHIISRSETGQTLYVEPAELRDLNYQRNQTILELNSAINSLEIEYCKEILEEIDLLREANSLVFFLDSYLTRADFCHQNNYVLPELSSGDIHIKALYHPLIEKPVKNDIKLDKEQNLIISGPNTGGKTVSIKSLALCALFTKYALATPSDHCRIPFYENIFYLGNDQQNLGEGLSSFAGEVKAYSEMLTELTNSNLILIDEIFNSTSSEEASALAISLFSKIQEISQSTIVVSTHHQMLKTLIQDNASFLSAHVGFDPELQKPTYKLYTGAPGASQALSIFKKLTKDSPWGEEIYKESLKFLDNKMLNYEKLLEEVSKKENELTSLISQNKHKEQNLKNKEASLEGILKLKKEEKTKELDIKLKQVLDKAHALLKRVKQGELNSKNALLKAESEIKKDRDQLAPKKQAQEKDYSNLSIPEKVVEGESYFSIKLKQTVRVKKLDLRKKIALVQKGALTIPCPLESLRVANVSGNSSPTNNFSINTSTKELKLEHDCRGMRLEEFRSLVESSIPDLYTEQVPFLTFIHGHGTGVLKKWLRDYIKKNKELAIVPSQTGNDGETQVKLA